MTRTELMDANLRGASLTNAYFNFTDFTGADVIGASSNGVTCEPYTYIAPDGIQSQAWCK
jgi:uncharacterized protein YjbI with pentapeptide repeats